MRAFWYVSQQKLTALSADGGTLLERLGVSAKLGFGPATLEAGVQPTAGPKLQKAVDRLEKRLRRSASVVPLSGVAEQQPVTFFDYQGSSARNVSGSALYTAVVSETIGVLLVGSASNAIGASAEQAPLLLCQRRSAWCGLPNVRVSGSSE
jgi:hypothetical protein